MALQAVKKIGKNAPPKKIVREIKKLHAAGRIAETKPLCERLIELGLTDPGFLYIYAMALRQTKDYNGALVQLNAAHNQDPTDPKIINLMGLVFLNMKDEETAIELFKRATEMDQKYYDAWKNLGITLRSVERFHAAQIALTCAHFIDPSKVDSILALLDVYIETRNYRPAEELMERLFEREDEITPHLMVKRLQIAARLEDFPYIRDTVKSLDISGYSMGDQARVENMYAYYLQVHDFHDEALALLNKWVGPDSKQRPVSIELAMLMESHIATIHSEHGQLDEAIALHKRLLERYPNDVTTIYNMANMQFSAGKLDEAYDNYEVRWKWREFTTKRRNFSIPRWEGEPLEGKKLLVWREQGIGDEIRYGGLVADLENLGGSVTFEATPKLIPVWEHSYPWAKIEPEGEIECRGDEKYAGFDYQIPLVSLGKYFRPTVQSFFDKQKPWLKRYPEIEDKIRKDIQPKPDELIVGIGWRSANMSPSRARYLFQNSQLETLKQLPNIKWVNIQYDADIKEIEEVRELGLDLYHYDDIDQKDDLVTACGLLGACDIVVTVGSSVGDMTGALGIPTVYIGKSGSMVFLNTDEIPWYPTAKSYPIESNQGDAVIEKMINDWDEIVAWADELNTVDRYHAVDLPNSDVSKNLDLVYNKPNQ